ncbi:MAG: hypothetical protein Q8N99_01205 [Nanoarchaeota archaeon]|nr:hypothetical protein [Nanoarchaeota archaeon]
MINKDLFISKSPCILPALKSAGLPSDFLGQEKDGKALLCPSPKGNGLKLFPVIKKERIYSSFIIGENYGFDLNKTALTFGMVKPGGSANRKLFIQNNYNKKILVEIKSSGDLNDYIVASENDFYLNPKETKNISFSIYAPDDIKLGKYEGYIIVYYVEN